MKRSRPDFLIIGAAKCGTSSLASGLSGHPDIQLLPREVHYFSKHPDRGDDWYLGQFKAPDKIQGEKSPTYLYDPACHPRIKRLLPDVKLIVLLRDPVPRAFSNWNMRFRDRRLIAEALRYNQRHPKQDWLKSMDLDTLVEHYLSRLTTQSQRFQKPFDIIHRGLYADQIERLLTYFSRENLLILITERFFADPKNGYARICRFLGLPEFDPGFMKKQNAGVYTQDLAEHTRRKLLDYYRPHNHRLFSLLGYSVDEWTGGGGSCDSHG